MAGPADVSPLTLNRLSIYLRSLRRLLDEGVTRVSSQELAQRYHLSAAQIRKDLTQFGEFGIRGVGYDARHLAERLSALLGLERRHAVMVVGMGNLGCALTRYQGFNHGAFEVVAGVDADPAKLGRRVGAITIRPAAELGRLVRELEVEIGVLTVPAEAAPANFAALVDAGVEAVLNFAPVRLEASDRVRLKNVDLRIHLEELAYFLRH